jgi:hypothetical protein
MALSYGAPPAKIGGGTSVPEIGARSRIPHQTAAAGYQITAIVGGYHQHFVDSPSIMSESGIVCFQGIVDGRGASGKMPCRFCDIS